MSQLILSLPFMNAAVGAGINCKLIYVRLKFPRFFVVVVVVVVVFHLISS